MNNALARVHEQFDSIFAPARAPIGGAAMENFDRYLWQSMRSGPSRGVAPLPLTFEQAWEEAHGEDYARSETLDGAFA